MSFVPIVKNYSRPYSVSMNGITRIQVEFGEPMAQRQVPVRHALATASRLPGMETVDSNAIHGTFTKNGRPDQRSVEVDRLIARIREALQKQGIR